MTLTHTHRERERKRNDEDFHQRKKWYYIIYISLVRFFYVTVIRLISLCVCVGCCCCWFYCKHELITKLHQSQKWQHFHVYIAPYVCTMKIDRIHSPCYTVYGNVWSFPRPAWLCSSSFICLFDIYDHINVACNSIQCEILSHYFEGEAAANDDVKKCAFSMDQPSKINENKSHLSKKTECFRFDVELTAFLPLKITKYMLKWRWNVQQNICNCMGWTLCIHVCWPIVLLVAHIKWTAPASIFHMVFCYFCCQFSCMSV